ncbi:hypothetical protein [Oceanirhabdus sp. W0125-5]|nr:hypothetical protein [Oceanirhabdus sp. W0125-5]WBW95372.1 hypothetical protein OW730_16970 [Oceanirhabdus sp. W0125-5]
MSKSRSNAKANGEHNDDSRRKSNAKYPLDRNPKHNKQEPTKGLPQI